MQPPIKEKPKVPWKTALETTDQPYHRKVPLLKVGEEGAIGGVIDVELESKDLQAHWQQHTQALWFVIAICALYFFYILVFYG